MAFFLVVTPAAFAYLIPSSVRLGSVRRKSLFSKAFLFIRCLR